MKYIAMNNQELKILRAGVGLMYGKKISAKVKSDFVPEPGHTDRALDYLAEMRAVLDKIDQAMGAPEGGDPLVLALKEISHISTTIAKETPWAWDRIAEISRDALEAAARVEMTGHVRALLDPEEVIRAKVQVDLENKRLGKEVG